MLATNDPNTVNGNNDIGIAAGLRTNEPFENNQVQIDMHRDLVTGRTGASSTEQMPPFVVVNYIIKT